MPNSDTKIYTIVKYLLQHCSENSRTWSMHVRHLSRRYGLEDPLDCLNRDPPSKSQYKEMIAVKITAYFENSLRLSASTNSQMDYLHVATIGLRGRHHPALANIITTKEVKQARPHLKFLAGNYLTYQMKADQSGGSARCRICTSGENETVSHVISTCTGMEVERSRLLEEFKTLSGSTKNQIQFEDIAENEKVLCQFILDPSSLNLHKRVSLSDPLLKDFFKLSREFCFIIDKTRVNSWRKLLVD